MRRILIPCYSDAPDRAHNSVVIEVTDDLIDLLQARRGEFEGCYRQSKDLYQLEYRHELLSAPLFLVGERDGILDPPEGPVELEQYLKELEIEEYELEPAPYPYLSVVIEGFFYSWDGSQNKYGPSETYFTQTFTVEQLEGATCPATA